ncbi:MAG: hypothetical protein ACXAE3_02305 [Candidatus Kariarchaeaceae archaeon]|jgi:hypothetical protein
MDSLLVSVSKVENAFILVENLIHNIYVYEMPEGKLIVNLRFNQSKDHDSTLIGGLTATIQEFSPDAENHSQKSINMDDLNLLFVAHDKFLIVFAVNGSYPDEQFKDALDAFVDSFEGCIENQEYGMSVDGAAVAVQTIHNLISEEIHMEVQLGPTVTIYPFKLRELADTAAQKLLGKEKDAATDLYDDTETQEAIKAEQTAIMNPTESLNQLLGEFLATFADVKEITLIKTSMTGDFEQYTQSRMEDALSDEVNDIVMGMIDAVSHLLEETVENRTVDLDEQMIFFQKVTDLSFLYLVIEATASMDSIEPIINRIVASIQNLFPDE